MKCDKDFTSQHVISMYCNLKGSPEGKEPCDIYTKGVPRFHGGSQICILTPTKRGCHNYLTFIIIFIMFRFHTFLLKKVEDRELDSANKAAFLSLPKRQQYNDSTFNASTYPWYTGIDDTESSDEINYTVRHQKMFWFKDNYINSISIKIKY